MATTSKQKENQIFIQIGDERIEATGEVFEQIVKDQTQQALLETEYKAKQEARDSAIKKLGEIAGLTKEELDAIL